MTDHIFPSSQRELLRTARGVTTQAAFAAQIGVDRSCFSRYESEKLGAPTKVLNQCLEIVAKQHASKASLSTVDQALLHVRQAANVLEALTKAPHLRKRGAKRR